MSDIQPTGPMGPSDAAKAYETDYMRGASLFDKALDDANKTSYDPKKAEFDKVMNQALEILNQSAQGLKNQQLMQQNEKISEDFKAYQQCPDKAHLDALRKDLDTAKHSFD